MAGERDRDGPSPARADALRSRSALLEAAGVLLAERGREFSLRDAASVAGVSAATAYRHFSDLSHLVQAYHLGRIQALADRLRRIARRQRGIDLYTEVCACWVETIMPHAAALRHARQAEGFVASVRRNAPVTSAIYSSLSDVLGVLIRDGVIPDQDHDYAILLWITLFDERLLVDLWQNFHYPPGRIASVVGSSVLAAWRSVPIRAEW